MPKTGEEKTQEVESGIAVYVYRDVVCEDIAQQEKPVHTFLDFGKTYTAEDLCTDVARELNISSLSLYLFGLANFDNPSVWLAPNAEVECTEDSVAHFWFRLRFRPLLKMLARKDPETFSYFFLQCRHDFVNDTIQYKGGKLGQDRSLGLGVTDMVRFGKENGKDLNFITTKLKPKLFIPVSAKNVFQNFLDKKRLKLNFKPQIEKEYLDCERDSLTDLKMRYIVNGILMNAPQYGMEQYEVQGGESLYVEPYNQQHPGLYSITKTATVQEVEHFAKIEDLMDASVSSPDHGETKKDANVSSSDEDKMDASVSSPDEVKMCRVTVNRKNGVPKTVYFEKREMALSFVSCLDGYHRLMESFHHHLCRHVVSPQLLQLSKSLRCHGPVSQDWASRRLLEKHRQEPDRKYNYLLRQKFRAIGDFSIAYITLDNRIVHLAIKRLPTGQYQMATSAQEPLFDGLGKLIEHYSSDKHPHIRLLKGVPVTNPLDELLYLCRTESKSTAISRQSGPVQHQSSVKLVSSVQAGSPLGKGRFTEVIEGRLHGDEKTISVAVKQLRADQAQTNNAMASLQALMTALHRASFWSCVELVKVHALCLDNPFRALLDHCPLGPLNAYLHKPREALTLYLLLGIVEQVSQALYYLQHTKVDQDGNGEVHGNLRCRNILVYAHTPTEGIQVKVADPGMVHLYNSQHLTWPVNLDRLPWLAPECYSNSGQPLAPPTIYSDRFAFGVTMWEILARGKRPYEEFTPEKIYKHARSAGIPPKLKDMDPKEYDTIKRCCDPVPENRIEPKEILRNIRDRMTEVGEHYSVLYDDDTETSEQPELDQEPLAQTSAAILAQNNANQDLYKIRQHHVDLDGGVSSPPSTPTSPSEMSLGSPSDSRTPLLQRSDSDQNSELVLPIATLHNGPMNTGEAEMETGEGRGFSLPGMPSMLRVEAIQNRPLPETPQMLYNSNILDRDRLRKKLDVKLGQGHYGEVYKGYYRMDIGNEITVAVKSLKASMYEKYANEFEKEFNIMVQLKHDNIVQIIGQCPQNDRENPMLLVMEFVERGCLQRFLQKERGKFGIPNMLNFAGEIAEGMLYLSRNHIVHRDLAARNVLVTKELHMKISDFGLSRTLSPDRDYYKCGPEQDIPADWCAPEALIQHKFTHKGDVWSYGVTVWEIYSCGKKPYLCNVSNLPGTLHAGKRLARPEACPEKVYRGLLFKCWQYKEEERANFEEVVKIIADFKSKLAKPAEKKESTLTTL